MESGRASSTRRLWVPDGDGMLSSTARMALLAAPLTLSGPSPLCELPGGRFPEHLAANALIVHTSVLLGVLFDPVCVTSKFDAI